MGQHYYSIAGIPVGTNIILPQCQPCESNADVFFTFHEQLSTEGGIEYTRDDLGLRAMIHPDGQHIYAQLERPTDDLALIIRATLPYAMALQGIVILHAMAFVRDNRVFAVVGESSAGKSTLGQALTNENALVISDDLLPLALQQDRIHVYREPHKYLDRLWYLERDRGLDKLVSTPLPSSTALGLLLLHGFGEVENSLIWKRQFEACHRIAMQCQHATLTVPDDLVKLPQTVKFLLEMSGR
jgi:hypothetical protein